MSSLLSNLTAFWRLGEAVGPLVDATGRGNHLTPYLRIDACTTALVAGGNVSATQELNGGALKGWGKWTRLLTAGEKAALAGGEYWPFSTTTSLQDAKAYHLFDEASNAATYADATGRGNTLTRTGAGSTSQVTGPNGGGDKGTAVNVGGDAYLKSVSPAPADLQFSQVTTTVAGWVKLATKAGTQQIFWGQLDHTPTDPLLDSGINVYYDATADRFIVDFDAGAGNALPQGQFVVEATLGSPATGTWYFVLVEFDVAAHQASIAVNNGTKSTLSNILQPLSVAGKIGNASQFVANPVGDFATRVSGWDHSAFPSINVPGNSFASHASNADLSFGNNTKTVWGWFKTTDASKYQTFAGIFDGTNAGTDWVVQIAANVLYFVMGNDQAFASIALADTNWHLVVCWFDVSGNQLHIDLDHGAVTASATGPTTPQTIAEPFRLGADGALSVDHQFPGLLNLWGIANGMPDAADLAALWNNGTGWDWPAPHVQFNNRGSRPRPFAPGLAR